MIADTTVSVEWARSTCQLLLDRRSAGRLGFGVDVYREGEFHYPDAYGLFLKAAVRIGRSDLAAESAAWLINNASLSDAKAPGWGLPYEYRTFGDRPNPRHTIYGITTALVVSGLMDWFEVSGEDSAIRIVEAALNHYSQYCTGKSFFYSTLPADNKVVPNVDGMLAGQYARCAGLIEGDSSRRFKVLAKGVYDNLLECMASDGSWPYRLGAPKKNDVLHHAYVLYGLQEVETALSLESRLAPARRFLLAYRQGDSLREMPRPPLSRTVMELAGLRRAEPARLWGLGAWLAACDAADVPAATLKKIVDRYRGENGQLWVGPLRRASSVRQEAHAAWGLAQHFCAR